MSFLSRAQGAKSVLTSLFFPPTVDVVCALNASPRCWPPGFFFAESSRIALFWTRRSAGQSGEGIPKLPSLSHVPVPSVLLSGCPLKCFSLHQLTPPLSGLQILQAISRAPFRSYSSEPLGRKRRLCDLSSSRVCPGLHPRRFKAPRRLLETRFGLPITGAAALRKTSERSPPAR